ncbi:hypothetical protein F4604DRAFT_1925000 [Suillus subluteus]|nr:hypothetical protein F4604DRAFT_1925000 [Suillus subluteus]
MSSDGIIGIGGFKMAHKGWLTLMLTPSSGLGSEMLHNVVVKRLFHRVHPPGMLASNMDFRIGCFTLIDEMPKLFREANILYWAKALLGLVYDFIDCAIASTSESPPFNIPHVRFIEAGLALSFFVGGGKPSSKTGTTHAAFLLEEVIDCGDEGHDFTKFIHNMDPNPLLDPEDFGYDFALFLAFTQHVQYVKTSGLAFISDYQGIHYSTLAPTQFSYRNNIGNTGLLTDPQIMTDPSVSDGDNIFGEGNIGKAVSEFEKRHICNDFCRWPGFALEAFGA